MISSSTERYARKYKKNVYDKKTSTAYTWTSYVEDKISKV